MKRRPADLYLNFPSKMQPGQDNPAEGKEEPEIQR